LEGALSTAMGCRPELLRQDEWLATLLESGPTLDVGGPTLTLRAGEVVVTMLDREVAEPGAALVGTAWHVDTLLSAVAACTTPAGADLELRFPSPTSFTVSAPGGPSVAGAMAVAAGQLVVTVPAGGDDACPPPWPDTLGVLRRGTVDYQISGNRLTLHAGPVGLVAVARRDGAPPSRRRRDVERGRRAHDLGTRSPGSDDNGCQGRVWCRERRRAAPAPAPASRSRIRGRRLGTAI
jgi:hypothetical protein